MTQYSTVSSWIGRAVLLALFLIGGSPRVAAAAGPQPQPTADFLSIRKEIVLRLVDGTPVPGIQVELAPATPTLGGPPAGLAAQMARTDAAGVTTFHGLGPWIWMVSFQGTFQGRPLQPVSEQGRAPYGRTRQGGGFSVQVELQEEEEPPTPVVVAGAPQPLTEPAAFVLVPAGAYWAPVVDLAVPAESPDPLSASTSPAPKVSSPPAAEPTPAETNADIPGRLGSLFLVAGGTLAIGAGVRAWRRRRARQRSIRPRPSLGEGVE